MSIIISIQENLQTNPGINPNALFNKKEIVTATTIGPITLPKNKTIIQPKNENITKWYSKSDLILPYTPKQRAIGRNLSGYCSLVNEKAKVDTLIQIAKELNISSMNYKAELIKNIREFLGCD